MQYYITKFFLTTLFLVINLGYAQQSTFERTKKIKIGIIDRSEHTTGKSISDLLSVEFSEESEFTLLERKALHKIMEERELSTALSSPKKRHQLGKTAGADFLVIVDMEDDAKGDEYLDLRTVDCRTGAVAYRRYLPVLEENFEEIAMKAVSITNDKISWLSNTNLNQLVPVSVPDLASLNPDSVSDRNLAEQIRRNMIVSLSDTPGIICLEREEIQKARREIKTFEGESVDFWNSALILTGSAGLQGSNLDEFYLNLKINNPQKHDIHLQPLTGKTLKLKQMLKNHVEKLAKMVNQNEQHFVYKPFDYIEEIQLLSQLSNIYYTKKQYDKAQNLLEQAIALQNQPPTKNQCFTMAGILQRVKGYERRGDIPPKNIEEYLKLVNRYIYMYENYILPYSYTYKYTGIVRRDMYPILIELPIPIKNNKIDPEAKPLSKKEVLLVQRAEYLRRLYIKSENYNILLYSRNPQVILTKIEQIYKEMIRQYLNPAKQDSEDFEGKVYFRTMYRNASIKQNSGDPLSDNESERAKFVLSILDRFSAISSCYNGKNYYYNYDINKLVKQQKVLRKLYLNKLCDKLNLSKESKALIFIHTASHNKISNIGSFYNSFPIKYSEFEKHISIVYKMINESDHNHWSLKILKSDNNGKFNHLHGKLIEIYWKAFFHMSDTQKKHIFYTFIKPTIVNLQDSNFSSHKIFLHWIYLKIFRKDSKFIVNNEYVIIDLLTLFKNIKHTKIEYMLCKKIKNKLLKNYPELAEKIRMKIDTEKRFERQKSKQNVVWPNFHLDKHSNELDFIKFNTLLTSAIDENILWMLFISDKKPALVGFDLSTKKLIKAGTLLNVHIPSHPLSRVLTTYNWYFTKNDIYLGMNKSKKYNRLGFYTTYIIPKDGNSNIINSKRLDSLIERSVPADNNSVFKPNLKKTSHNITVFTGMEDYLYFANDSGIYQLNQHSNTLHLLASNHMPPADNSLNGGLSYLVYWMKADTNNNRILMAVKEKKVAKSWKFIDRTGDRTGLWAFYPERQEFEFVRKFAFSSYRLPDALSMTIVGDEIIFNSRSVCGKYNLKSNTAKCILGDIFIGDDDHWQYVKPIDHVVSGKRSETTRLVHPYQDTRIVYKWKSEHEKYAYWIENDEIIQTVLFRNIILQKTFVNSGFSSAFKIIPIPGGAVVWYLRKNKNGKKEPALLFWEVNPERDGKEIIYELK